MNYFFAVLPFIGALLCTALGLFTLLRNPRQPANLGFAAGLGSLALMEAGGALILLSAVIEKNLLSAGIRIFFSGLAAMPSAWLFFSVAFARANHREMLTRWAPILLISSLVSVFFIIKSGSPYFIHPAPVDASSSLFARGKEYFIFGPLGRYFFIFLILGLVLNLVHLENTLRSSTGSKRWQIKYVIFGVGSILAYFIYLSSQALLFSSLRHETVPLTSSIIIISAGMMALFIAKHRLLDVDIFVSRYVIYNSFTVLAVGVYLLAIGIIAYGIRYFDIPFNYFLTALFVFTSVLALVIFLFTASLRRKVKLFINRHFYKHKYEFRDKWMETTERISSKRSVPEIAATLSEMVSEEMCAKPVILWLYDPAARAFTAWQEGGLDEDLRKVPRDHPLAVYLEENPNPFMKTEAGPGQDIKAVFSATDTVLCAPLVAGSEVVGFIMLGADISGQPYIQDDFEFLKAVATQAAVQIKNIRLSGELLASKEVEAFSRMSSFIMHDLKNLTNSLSLISQNAKFNINNPEFQQDAIRTIDATVSRMKRLIDRLSNIPMEFEFRKENTDVNELIHRVMKKAALPVDKDIVVTNEAEALPPIYIDPEAIEMVIFNLIANAYDAIPKKGVVRVRSSLNGRHVAITVSDNGSGISKEYISTALFQPFRTTKKSGFGIGLFQCKSIIEAHGGDISVVSQPGVGTDFTIKLPVEKEFLGRDWAAYRQA